MYCAQSSYNVATCHGMSCIGFSPSSSPSLIKGEGTKILRPLAPSLLGVFRQYSLAPSYREGQGEGDIFSSLSGVIKWHKDILCGMKLVIIRKSFLWEVEHERKI